MNFKVGDIIHTFIRDITPNKNKYMVYIQPDENWALLINTENREIYECVEILCENYKFLKEKNRYVSCARIFQIPKDELEDATLYGKLNHKDLENIFNKIKQSRKLSPVKKQRILSQNKVIP